MGLVRRRIQTVPDGDQRGKDAKGRFTAGNRYGGHNQYGKMQEEFAQEIRRQLREGTNLQDFVAACLAHAKRGRGIYLLALLERACGKVYDYATDERLRELEEMVMASVEQQPIEGVV